MECEGGESRGRGGGGEGEGEGKDRRIGRWGGREKGGG